MQMMRMRRMSPGGVLTGRCESEEKKLRPGTPSHDPLMVMHEGMTMTMKMKMRVLMRMLMMPMMLMIMMERMRKETEIHKKRERKEIE